MSWSQNSCHTVEWQSPTTNRNEPFTFNECCRHVIFTGWAILLVFQLKLLVHCTDKYLCKFGSSSTEFWTLPIYFYRAITYRYLFVLILHKDDGNANRLHILFITYSNHIQFRNRVRRIRALPLHNFIKVIFSQPVTFFKCYKNPSVKHISLQSTFGDTALILPPPSNQQWFLKFAATFRNRVLIRGLLFCSIIDNPWLDFYFFPVRGESFKLKIRN